MIIVREVFSIDPEQMKAAKELMREYLALSQKLDHPKPRVMTDLVADHYTLVMETEFPDMGTFERLLQTTFAKPEWQSFYPRFRKLLRGGRREIYSTVE
jgi:hypothetical protein